MPDLNNAILRMFNVFWADLKEAQRNASCNEFNLARMFPNPEDRAAIMREVLVDEPETFDPNADYSVVNDHDLAKWIGNVVRDYLSDPIRIAI